MLEKKTIVDQLEITRTGAVQVRLGLLIVDDGREVDCKWHRTVIEPGGLVDEQMAAVNAHLEQMGRLPVDDAGIAYIKKFVAAAAS